MEEERTHPRESRESGGWMVGGGGWAGVMRWGGCGFIGRGWSLSGEQNWKGYVVWMNEWMKAGTEEGERIDEGRRKEREQKRDWWMEKTGWSDEWQNWKDERRGMRKKEDGKERWEEVKDVVYGFMTREKDETGHPKQKVVSNENGRKKIKRVPWWRMQDWWEKTLIRNK